MAKVYTLAEIQQHNNKKSVWVIINDEIFDVTGYLEEHPGGPDVLIEHAGKDGTQDFEDVGHSEDARQLMKKFKIGVLAPSDRQKSTVKNEEQLTNLKYALIALAGAVVIGFVLRKYLS